MQEVSFFVPGVPVPQGSKNAGVRGGRAYMWEANKKHKPWRDKVTAEATKHLGAFGKDTPVEVHAIFVFDRPKSVTVKKRPRMSVKPDLDKLMRSICDSISKAGVWGDDARMVKLVTQKLYPNETSLALGAHITIREVTE